MARQLLLAAIYFFFLMVDYNKVVATISLPTVFGSVKQELPAATLEFEICLKQKNKKI